MEILVTIAGATQVAPALWEAEVAPANVRQLGQPLAEFGVHSVVLVDQPRFRCDVDEVAFPLNAARVLNVGSSSRTIFIAAERQPLGADTGEPPVEKKAPAIGVAGGKQKLGLGDRQLIRKLENFPDEMKAAAERVIAHVRALDPHGDFQQSNNRFVNRRDNFVAVEPQTQKKQLLINVRGKVATSLQTLSTFNGYTAFKLSRPEDLPAVLSAIANATRKLA